MACANYNAQSSYDARFAKGDYYEDLCMRLLRKRAKLHYIKNPKSRRTDLMDKHGIYPMIEVKSCTSPRIAIDEETGHPQFIIIQRYKDSLLGPQDSGLTIQNAPGEEASISGATPLPSLEWTAWADAPEGSNVWKATLPPDLGTVW